MALGLVVYFLSAKNESRIRLIAVMKRSVLFLSMLLAGFAFAQRATLDDTAKFLAGLPVKGPLEPLTRNASLAKSRHRHEHGVG